jgi:predicted methyltransferase
MLILQEDIEHKSILLLGDDDLMSIALSAANVTCQITVVDFDEALLELIASNTDSSRARTFLWDLRKPLPLSFEKQYDFVLTDPPYTIDGQLTFLRQAILALRPAGNSTLLFCASRLYLCENRLQEIFAFLANSSLRCAEAYENFNEYEAPPDVLQDMRRLDPESMATTFHSTLFRYIAGSTPIRLAAINPIPGNIYSYDQNNVTS